MGKQHDLARQAAGSLGEAQTRHMVGDRVHQRDAKGATTRRGKVVFAKNGYGRQHLHVHWDGEQHPFHDRRPGDGKADPKPVPGSHVHHGEG